MRLPLRTYYLALRYKETELVDSSSLHITGINYHDNDLLPYTRLLPEDYSILVKAGLIKYLSSGYKTVDPIFEQSIEETRIALDRELREQKQDQLNLELSKISKQQKNINIATLVFVAITSFTGLVQLLNGASNSTFSWIVLCFVGIILMQATLRR